MNAPEKNRTGWDQSCRLLIRFLGGGSRLDHLLQDSTLDSEEGARCRFYLTGTIRNLGLLEATLDRLIPKRPRREVWSILLLASFEIQENPEQTPKIVHFAVEQAKRRVTRPECGLINSVLRKVSPLLNEMVGQTGGDVAALSTRFSHPEWLIRRWVDAYGTDSAIRLLEWNQKPAPTYARVLQASDETPGIPAGALATAWPGFVDIGEMPWKQVAALLDSGTVYIQDPATRLAPDLMGIDSPGPVLDLCAAPGGKSLQLAERAGRLGGRVVSVDLAGPKLTRLKENVSRYPKLPIDLLGADVRKLTTDSFRKRGLPDRFRYVLIDVPCSNTGVLRHRVDAKWRLREADLISLTRLQGHLLTAAARFVAPGGRLVYSTCSLEPAENQGVVNAFLQDRSDFRLVKGLVSLPWETGHDGAGCFLLERFG